MKASLQQQVLLRESTSLLTPYAVKQKKHFQFVSKIYHATETLPSQGQVHKLSNL